MKKVLPLTFITILLFQTKSFSQATVPYTTCPDVNIGIARAGFNADITNPYFLYNVNTTSGAFTIVPGGPYKDPTDNSNLQINGVGVNKTDGYIYGLAYQSSLNTAKFVRVDKNYGVTLFGDVAPPTSSTGPLGFVNAAAGDVDRLNNYYFSGFTGNIGGPTGTLLDKIFLGKISNISTISGTPTVQYFEVDYSDVPCGAYISTLTTDPNNSGLKDFVFNPTTNTFFTYVTYKPTGAANFSGQLVELKPVAGSSPLKYKMFCSGVVNTHTAEVAGTLIDNSGNFEVLFTDGTMGKLTGNGASYTGAFTVLNTATGLPNPIRADLAGCGGPSSGPLPVRLSSFDFTQQNCITNIRWVASSELNLNHYEVEQSFNAVDFTTVINVVPSVSKNYIINLKSPGLQAYYRLKIIDADGNFSYSSVINVANNCTNKQSGFSVYPNPVFSTVSLNWYGIEKNTTAEISIYNSIGIKVKAVFVSLAQGNSISNIDVSGLAKGSYFIKTIDLKNKTELDSKFLKQ